MRLLMATNRDNSCELFPVVGVKDFIDDDAFIYEGLLRTKFRICIYPCYVAYMNVMRNKSISKHVRYKLKVSDKTKRCPTQLKDAW